MQCITTRWQQLQLVVLLRGSVHFNESTVTEKKLNMQVQLPAIIALYCHANSLHTSTKTH